MRRLLLALSLALAGPALAQDSTLADIRTELARLYAEIEGLRGELTASGQLTQGIAGNTPLERLNAIEAELQRLTAKTEELEFRINRITVDGTNRIGDLEFRLCELEPGCDISLLGETPSLGGVDSAAVVPEPAGPLPGGSPGPALAIREQADFDAARAALEAGEFETAADGFARFVAAYPGSPLTGEALYFRGEALEALGRLSDAARAFLDSFSGDPDGPVAPDALLRLGVALGRLEQVPDACVTLGEVLVRFPGAPAVLAAQEARANLRCP